MFNYENVIEMLWKGMLVGMVSLMAAVLILLAGCVSSGDMSGSAYRAGRAGAVAYMLTAEAQSPATRTGLVVAYRALSAAIAADVPLDAEEAIEAEVDALLSEMRPAPSPELRAAVARAVDMLRARALAEMSDLPAKAAPDRWRALKSFKQGVDDALRDYGYAASDEGM